MLIEQLRRLNRRERFILLRDALGAETFTLDADFRQRLGQAIDRDVPTDAFVALDYPLDWLALALAQPGGAMWMLRADEVKVRGNPLDIDLLIAFGDAEQTQLVLIEAKASTAWLNDQLSAKAERLGELFPTEVLFPPKPDDFADAPVRPHFVLASPRPPQRVRTELWPYWMKPGGSPRWMQLRMPAGLRKATRWGNIVQFE
ncbi:MAG: hypothetical protein F4Y50_05155 [Dehalococcoidia bacterium]|nr:hypothetical protein [Dehalococcoidia bacterium]